jgi:hypothetical protein
LRCRWRQRKRLWSFPKTQVREHATMTSSLRRPLFVQPGLTALLGMALTLAFAATLSAQVVRDPRVAEFDPSADHWALLENGDPVVLRYKLEVYVVGASMPFVTADLGKPSPDPDGKIRCDLSALAVGWPPPGGDYLARVRAVGPEGSALSEPSNTFNVSSAPFTDPSLSVGMTPIRLLHVAELRARINALRAKYGLGAYAWTDPTLVAGQTPLRAIHIAELRTALEAAHVAARRTPPVYTDPILAPGQTMLKAVHILELRNAVIALE